MTPKGQLGFFDQPEEKGSAPSRRKPEIDLKRIEADLVADAGSGLKVKVVKWNGYRVRCEETDKAVKVRINPKRIRTQAQLDQVIAAAQDSINWPAQY